MEVFYFIFMILTGVGIIILGMVLVGIYYHYKKLTPADFKVGDYLRMYTINSTIIYKVIHTQSEYIRVDVVDILRNENNYFKGYGDIDIKMFENDDYKFTKLSKLDNPEYYL